MYCLTLNVTDDINGVFGHSLSEDITKYLKLADYPVRNKPLLKYVKQTAMLRCGLDINYWRVFEREADTPARELGGLRPADVYADTYHKGEVALPGIWVDTWIKDLESNVLSIPENSVIIVPDATHNEDRERIRYAFRDSLVGHVAAQHTKDERKNDYNYDHVSENYICANVTAPLHRPDVRDTIAKNIVRAFIHRIEQPLF